MIRTRLTDVLGIDHPIVSAPMARSSGGRLAGAVSAAGALGTFGASQVALRIDAAYVRDQIAAIRAITDRPFGVGFLTNNLPASPANFDAAMEEGAPVALFSFGDPTEWVGRARDAGARIVCQVQSMADAEVAVAAGTDVLAVQGNEAGGHTGRANLLPFLVQVLDAFPDVAVIAAGAMTSGRAVAAVLAAGADGAWMGTAFTAVAEADEVRPIQKEAVLASDGRDTVASRVFDVMNARAFGDVPWPDGTLFRVRRNDFVEEWLGREDELSAAADELTPAYIDAYRQQDATRIALPYGEGAGTITAIRPAAEVINDTIREAERCLSAAWSRVVERDG